MSQLSSDVLVVTGPPPVTGAFEELEAVGVCAVVFCAADVPEVVAPAGVVVEDVLLFVPVLVVVSSCGVSVGVVVVCICVGVAVTFTVCARVVDARPKIPTKIISARK